MATPSIGELHVYANTEDDNVTGYCKYGSSQRLIAYSYEGSGHFRVADRSVELIISDFIKTGCSIYLSDSRTSYTGRITTSQLQMLQNGVQVDINLR